MLLAPTLLAMGALAGAWTSLPWILPLPAAGAAARAAAEPGEPERVEVTTEDKLVLVGSFYGVKASRQVSPGALLVHDAGGKRADLQDLAERLNKQGFSVLALDLRGHGESRTGEHDWATSDEAGRERLWAFAMRDLKAASDFLRSQPSVHAANLSLVGHGAGCALAARFAVRSENVRALVLLQPQAEQLGFNIVKDMESLGGLPTYIGVSTDDQSNAKRLAEFGARANGGIDFIQIAVFKNVGPTVLSDRRMPADIARWLKDKAMPSRGR